MTCRSEIGTTALYSKLPVNLKKQWWAYRIRTCDHHRVNSGLNRFYNDLQDCGNCHQHAGLTSNRILLVDMWSSEDPPLHVGAGRIRSGFALVNTCRLPVPNLRVVTSACCRLHGQVKLPPTRLLARVNERLSGTGRARFDGDWSPTVWRLKAMLRITY